jgi:hypothetical protein
MRFIFQEINTTSFVTLLINHSVRSRANIVGIATGYGLDDRGVRVQVLVGSRIFF